MEKEYVRAVTREKRRRRDVPLLTYCLMQSVHV